MRNVVEVEITAVLGKTRMTLGEILGLGRGAVIEFDVGDGEQVEILGNGHPIARGDVLVRGPAISVEVKAMTARDAVNRDPGTRIGDFAALGQDL